MHEVSETLWCDLPRPLVPLHGPFRSERGKRKGNLQMSKIAVSNNFHAMSFDVTNAGNRTIITLKTASGERLRAVEFTGLVRDKLLADLAKEVERGDRGHAMSLLWAALGYSRRMLDKPIARTICHPGRKCA